MYIARQIQAYIFERFQSPRPKGLILAGMVGSGKTTLAQYILKNLKKEKCVFQYSGDDIQFRTAVAEDSKFIYKQITTGSKSDSDCIVFVDEVQKSESIFDAIKYAFDHAKISFIVSGPNPHYLSTVARQRLQRRAELVTIFPLSLPEILIHSNGVSEEFGNFFSHLLFDAKSLTIPTSVIKISSETERAIDRYLRFGGLPLAYLSADREALVEIKQTVERGFESFLVDTENIQDTILVELAKIQSQEFTYTHIFQKTGLRRRDQINLVIEKLRNYGYLVTKKPVFLNESRRSYLNVHTWTDPGILSYLLGSQDLTQDLGHRIEGVIHTRLKFLMQTRPFKNELGYFKPYRTETGNNNIKFLPGEIDFIYLEGQRRIPIEVKATASEQSINTSLLESTIVQNKMPFGIVLYGGLPRIDQKKKIIYWPWWIV